ncbi:chemotaxis protein CheB [Chryseolinea sp. T2]|uniref:chemotaxis protein CheB n=1 Tax=Chryseolinea sp. T2 TaxID=3129255 RepID=UPI003076BE43
MDRDKHFIVAIGASAGGLEAIHEFFDNMPEAKNMSFVIIQHLSPDYKSLLVDLVSRHTHMKVYEATSEPNIERNCIYVIPNNKFITIKGYKLVLTDKSPLKFPNNAIDVFLEPLAREHKQQAIALILSGTGTDGTKGISAIKEHGGMVIVQDPASARFDGMPNSAIATGNTDHILTPREMPAQILSYVKEMDDTAPAEIDDDTLMQIFGIVQQQSGFDFHYYKSPTVTRRIFHRMRKNNFRNPRLYVEHLRSNPGESLNLGKDLLINVTRFFRDTDAFGILKAEVLPAILKKKEDKQIKIWVCACSTGEEAYSIAMLIEECIAELGYEDVSFKIFASDAERSNIEIASKGHYPAIIANDVSDERLQKFFVATSTGYAVKPVLRKKIVFAVHNVIHNPPFVKNDLVTCRNMLIYMNPRLQERIYSVLLFAANINGYLFLGPTENPNPIVQHLKDVSTKWKVFRKISNAKVSPLLGDMKDGHPRSNGNGQVKGEKVSRLPDLWEEFKSNLFSDFNFAAFHIDRNFEIKDAVGNYDRILALPKKILKLNLIRMLPSSVSSRLVAEIKKVWKSDDKKVVRNLSYTTGDKTFYLQALIQSESHSKLKNYTLVAFHFMELETSTVSVATGHSDNATSEYVLALEEELNETKNNLQYAIEDLETANEELQSSNEELLSANEELQSSNEELQSLNEELHTLNTEHQLKIHELVELNDDLTNYFRSSNVAQIFLDRNMMIRKFNPAALQVINLIDSDLGRPINHISTNVRYTGLIADIELVLKHHETIEKEVELRNGTNMLLRIMPYVTKELQRSGVVISFLDITTVTNLNNIIRGVFNSSLSAIFALQAVRDEQRKIIDFSIETANHTANRLLKQDGGSIVGKRVLIDLNIAFFTSLLQQMAKVVERDVSLHTDVYDEGNSLWFEVTAVKMKDGLVATITDITQKKQADERLKKNYIELISTKDSLKSLNAELENKITDRTRQLSESEERFRMVARATNDVIWDWDIVNNQLWLSDAFCANFGYEKSLITRAEWLNMVHPDERDEVDDNILHALNAGVTQWTGEYRFKHASGSYHNVLDRGYVMHDQYGTPYRMLGSILDISEIKKAEMEIANNVAQRKFLAESMPLIVWTAAADGAVDFVNRHFELYTGLSYDLAIGKGWEQAIHADDLDRLQHSWSSNIERGSDFQEELRIRLSDGTYHWNILRAKAQKDPAGAVVNWVVTTIDINDQKQLSEVLERKVQERTTELRNTNYALEVSNNDLQQFASVASHDLQEPLRKIHMYASMIRDRKASLAENGTTYIEKILASSSRMKSIITNILNYSKLSAKDINFETTNIRKLIDEILDDLEIAIREKNAKVYVSEFPLIETVPGQIRQVFQNIIGNSLKFSRPNTPPVVRIDAVRTAANDLNSQRQEDGPWCRITIADNGIGFNPKFAEQIFLIFQRLHSKDTYEGTGIGLAIAKKIIEKHNGIISARGNDGEGAIFTIVLPVHQST